MVISQVFAVNRNQLKLLRCATFSEYGSGGGGRAAQQMQRVRTVGSVGPNSFTETNMLISELILQAEFFVGLPDSVPV